MYIRNAGRYEVAWKPENHEIAYKCMEIVDGTGVKNKSDCGIENPVFIENDVSINVKKTYSMLMLIFEYNEYMDIDFINSVEDVESYFHSNVPEEYHDQDGVVEE